MSLQDPKDTSLIEQTQQGSEAAFETLFGRYRAAVFGHIVARVRRREDAEDIAQDTWKEVQKKLRQYDSNRANFAAFLKNHAHWKMVDYYRRRRDRDQVEILECDLQDPRCEEGPEATSFMEQAKDLAPSPETLIAQAERFARLCERLLMVTFSGNSPPHQLIAFGFAKLLEWKPREIVSQLSGRCLRDLEAQLEDKYLQIACGQETVLRMCFKRLREKMDCSVGEAIEDLNTRKVYTNLLDRITGRTILSDYYTDRDDPEQNIAHWCGSVKRRVLPELLESQDLAPLG